MKISIITPSYNQGKFLERTLRSVASQASPGIEVDHVVFDGGSTDNSLEILRNFSPKVFFVSQRDKGQADAVNQGIEATDGEIIGWLNSDDIYYPGAVKRVVDHFNAHPEVDIVYGMADHIDQQDHAFETYPSETWNFERLKETCFICQPAVFIRRRVVEQHGLLDLSLNYCMDYEYWIRMSSKQVLFDYLEEKLAGSRLYVENKTLSARVKVHIEINNMMKKKFGRVPDRWLFNYAHAVVDTRYKNIPKKIKIICLSFHSIISSLRWNYRISVKMMINIIRWIYK